MARSAGVLCGGWNGGIEGGRDWIAPRSAGVAGDVNRSLALARSTRSHFASTGDAYRESALPPGARLQLAPTAGERTATAPPTAVPVRSIAADQPARPVDPRNQIRASVRAAAALFSQSSHRHTRRSRGNEEAIRTTHTISAAVDLNVGRALAPGAAASAPKRPPRADSPPRAPGTTGCSGSAPRRRGSRWRAGSSRRRPSRRVRTSPLPGRGAARR